MRSVRHRLPPNFLDLPKAEQRRILVEHYAQRFKDGDPDAWFDLLVRAVTDDPDIPDDPYKQVGDDKPASVRTRLLSRLIQTMAGTGTLDPWSPGKRQKDAEDEAIYAELSAMGGSYVQAREAVAQRRGVSPSTIDRAYRRHVKRWDIRRRLDGRRK